MRQATLKRFEMRQEAPVKTFCRFGPLYPADYQELSDADRETPRRVRYAILQVGDEEIELLSELLPPGTVTRQGFWFEDRRDAKRES